MMGKVIDITSRLKQVAEAQTHEPMFAPPAPEGHDAPPVSGKRTLGERRDGTIDMAAWRAVWRPVFKKEFMLDLGLGHTTTKGSLMFFHDSRSNSLEFIAQGHDGATVRHVLPPVDAMRLLLNLNAAYGFDPEGPGGRRLSEWETDDRSPWDSGPSVA